MARCRHLFEGKIVRHIAHLLAIASVLYSGAAFAALGGAPLQPSQDRVSGKTVLRASVKIANYTKIETTQPSGTVVREFVSGNGIVFAVAWKGPFMPDLKALLGQHFDVMVDEAGKTTKAGHSKLTVNHADLVIQSGGHMRAFVGRAWIPSLLPNDFNIGDIR